MEWMRVNWRSKKINRKNDQPNKSGKKPLSKKEEFNLKFI